MRFVKDWLFDIPPPTCDKMPKMKKKSSLRSFLFNIYGYAFFDSLGFMYPVYMLFFASSGVSDTGASLLLILWSLFVVFTQIPVLFIANKFPRKPVLVISQLLKLSCFLVWAVWPTFWGFALGFLLWGIEWAIYNTVYEAMVYEELQARRRKDLYAKVRGRASAISNAAYIIGCSGSLMIPLGYEVIAGATCIAMLIATLFYANLKIQAKGTTKAKPQVMKSLRIAGATLRRAPYILYLMILCNAVYAFSQIDEYLGPIGVEIGFRPELVGGLFIGALLMRSLGGAMAGRFEKISDKKLFAGVSLIGVIMISLSVVFTLPGLIFLAAFYYCYSIVQILIYARFQHAAPSSGRTAFLSVYSFFEQGTVILSYMVMMAGIALSGGYRLSVLFTGVISILVGLWAMAYIPKKKKLYDRLTSFRSSRHATLK